MNTGDFYEGGKPFQEEGTNGGPWVITLHSMRTGARIRESALVAAEIREEAGGIRRLGKFLAAGEAVRPLEGTSGIAVFCPFREGGIACYEGAVFLFKTLLRKLGPFFPKPVVCAHAEPRTTQVGEIAMADGWLQAGARKVLLYRGSLSWALRRAAERRDLRRAVICCLEPLVPEADPEPGKLGDPCLLGQTTGSEQK